MQAHLEPSAGTGSRRVLVAIAIALAATVSAGVGLGHRSGVARAARLTPAGIVPATAPAQQATPARDPSLPSAATALERAPASFEEPAPTF